MRKLHEGNASFTLGQPYNPSVHRDPRSALRRLTTSLYKSIPNRLLFQKPTSFAVSPVRLVTGLFAGVKALMLEFQDVITSIAAGLTFTITSVGNGADVAVRVAVGSDVAVGTNVSVDVTVAVGVIVGLDKDPGPQPDAIKLITRTSAAVIRCLVFIFPLALSWAHPAATQVSRITV